MLLRAVLTAWPCSLLAEMGKPPAFCCLSRMSVSGPKPSNSCWYSLKSFLLFCLEMATHYIRVVTVLFIRSFQSSDHMTVDPYQPHPSDGHLHLTARLTTYCQSGLFQLPPSTRLFFLSLRSNLYSWCYCEGDVKIPNKYWLLLYIPNWAHCHFERSWEFYPDS